MKEISRLQKKMLQKFAISCEMASALKIHFDSSILYKIHNILGWMKVRNYYMAAA
jgi:hypothetical protein